MHTHTHTHTHTRVHTEHDCSMFTGRQYKRVSQQGESESDTTDNETAFFTSENGSRKWRMGTRLGNLNQDPELDLPYVHPTLPVETKKNKLHGQYTRRQFISGACLLIVILAMVAAFSATIILGQKFMNEAPPTTNNHNPLTTYTSMPAPTPLVNFDPTNGNELSFNESRAPVRQDSTQSASTGATTSSTTTKSISSVTSPPPTISTVKSTSTLHPTTSTAATERTNTAIGNDDTRLNPPPQIDSITTFKYHKESS